MATLRRTIYLVIRELERKPRLTDNEHKRLQRLYDEFDKAETTVTE